MATVERLGVNKFRRRIVAGCFPKFARLSDALKKLKFVQADPIRSPARAQDLVLRQRVANYAAGDLEEAFPKLPAEEGYLFAYGFMTPEVCVTCVGARCKLKKREREVLAAVSELGEVHPRDLDEKFGRKSVENYWGGKSQETKKILEKLHQHGYLRVSRREKGIRVYQVPRDDQGKMDDTRERYRQLALTTAHVFGPTTKRFLVAELRSQNHLLSSRAQRLAAVDALIETEQLAEITVDGITYVWSPQNWLSEEVPTRVRILAPFDPLVRDRDRFAQLWDWTYRFEAYVPAAKRERGYYAMPVQWRDKVVGWANAKVEDEQLVVEFGYNSRPRAKEYRVCAEAEVEALAEFLGLKSGAWQLTL